VSVATFPIISGEEYLEREIRAATQNDLYRAECFAKPGAGRTHDRIGTQIQFLIEQHLVGKSCEVFGPNVRVLSLSDGLSTYPDLTVVCDPPQFTDQPVDTITNPTLLVEIVSPSTENWDRGHKAYLYRSIPSVREFLMVAQDCYEVEVYRPQSKGTWVIIPARGLDASIEVTSIGLTVSLLEIYKRVISAAESEQPSHG